MPRRLRNATGGYVYHVLNRAVARGVLFKTDADYATFLAVLARVHERIPTRILSFCLMPTHWHLVLYPKRDDELSEFMRLLTVTHTQRWHAAHGTAGTGPLYQGRFKSFPVQRDERVAWVCRYVERNPLRAGLVRSADRWPWSSLSARETNSDTASLLLPPRDWPGTLPRTWTKYVNTPQPPSEEQAIHLSLQRSRPLGTPTWTTQTAARLGLESTLRSRGRPRLTPAKAKRENGK
jgi:putative transposase